MSSRSGLLIFNYHAFDGSGSIVSTAPALFIEQMQRLVEANFRCVDLERWVAGEIPDEDRLFALTFDDGDASILKVAEPLAQMGLTSSIFVVTDQVGTDNGWPTQPRWVPRSRLLGWDELAELQRNGFSIGSHTRTHPDLTKVDSAQLDREIKGAKAEIEDRLGTECPLFAYPYGHADRRTRRVVSETHAAGFGTKPARARCWDDPCEFARVDSYYLSYTPLLDRILAGEADAWLRARSKLRSIRKVVRWGRVG